MDNYLKRLKQHPGAPIAAMMTVAFAFAGLANESLSWSQGLVVGIGFSILPWAVVLWTARDQPITDGDE